MVKESEFSRGSLLASNVFAICLMRDLVLFISLVVCVCVRGAAVKTPFGPGKIKRYKKRSRCFVVNLDWTMGNGKSVKAYMQPADIVVLEVRPCL